MEILTGSCSGSSFACDNSSSSVLTEFFQSNTFTVGQTYYVRVFHTSSSLLTSSFTICVQNYPTPTNDICSGAISLTANTNCVTTTGSFSGSSNTGTSTSCSSASVQDVWYSFVATDPTMSVSLANNSSVDLGMEIVTGSCSGTSFACDNSSSSVLTEIFQSNTFTVGQTYYVRVFHTSSSLLTSSFTICVQNPTLSTTDFTFNKVRIYPNPVTDYFEIETQSDIRAVNLFTINGQLILTEKQKKISISNLPKGVYLIKLEDENGNIFTKRIVKN